MKKKVFLLFSGGLDSLIAYKVLKKASDLEIVCIFFETPFFPSRKPKYFAEINNIDLRIIKIWDEYVNILIKPRLGYGKHFNPCADCHAFMINKAFEIMEKENGEFIATGEVLGQRPKSQTHNAIRAINKIIKYPDKILRPLCAKLLNITEMEKGGLVNREKLLDLQGRSRKRQIKLAKELNIKEYATPAGGCMLTEPFQSNIIKKLYEKGLLDEINVNIIKNGRIIEYEKGFAVLGRNKEENNMLNEFLNVKKYQIEHKKGPVGIIIGELNEKEHISFINKLKEYSKNLKQDKIIEYY